MRKLTIFNSTSLDGYFADARNDMSFAHNASPDREWDAFVEGNAGGGAVLVFGRITYELMASFWPTPLAAQQMPAMAERLNSLSKIVFSRTLQRVTWSNTRLALGNLVDEIRKLKSEPGGDLTILGSGSLAAQLTQHRLIDEYQIVVIPVVLGQGRTMFAGVAEPVSLRLVRTRTFSNGNVLLGYEPQTS